MAAIFNRWVWRMAFRDARRGVRTLVLSMLCVVLGVASVVAAFSFRDNLESSLEEQAKTLLGADLAIESRRPFSDEAESLIASLGGEQSRQVRFSSMAYFPEAGRARLVQVRAVSGGFPYYGEFETEPPAAGKEFQGGAYALVDETLMLQFDARIGGLLRIADQDFEIGGRLRKIPGETPAFSLISPRVYVPLSILDETPLLQRGSMARHRVYFKMAPGVDVDRLVQEIGPQLEQLGLEAHTVTRRKASISRSLENLTRYLHLAVFIAVLLGGVGVASGIHVYTKEKTPSVAVLRCIGAAPGETVFVYLIQALAIALLGSCVGAAIGVAAQALLPRALDDFLPVRSIFSIAPRGVLAGLGIGLGVTFLFALLPLVALRKVSPLLALRASYEKSPRGRDPMLWLIYGAIAAAVAGFAAGTTERWLHALWFTAAVFGAFGFLALGAKGISALARKLIPRSLPYSWRQGLANLHRPNNQTAALMLAVGLGTFLLVTVFSVRAMLLEQVAGRAGQGEPNLVVFDIQRDQREALGDVFRSFDAPVYEEVPIVTMRLTAVGNRPVDDIRRDPERRIPLWTLRREYRSTYRDRLADTEEIVAGEWQGRAPAASQSIPVSIEQGIAESLRVGLGDELHFELQGVPLIARIASVRKVDWQRVQPNFFVVFPAGVLEEAPQFYALTTRIESVDVSARLQRALMEDFPNVSVIDLTLVLETLDSILGRVSQAIRFVALFILLTGLAVLAGAVLSSRSQRIRESILLRALGAARSQILGAIVAEYLFLGIISSAAGGALAFLASWGLGFYFLGVVPFPPAAPALAILLLITSATVLAGALGTWGIFRRPALEMLRAEGD
jgi:putative ABC transport system permease protein